MEREKTLLELADGHFEVIVQHIQKETDNMRVLSSFFQTIQCQLLQFGESIKDAMNVLIRSYKFLRVMDKWELGLAKAVQTGVDVLKTLNGITNSLGLKIIEPLDIFLKHYEQSNKGFLQDGMKVIEMLTSQRNKLKVIAEQIVKNVATNIADEKIYEDHKLQVNTLNDLIDEHEHAFRENVGFISKNEDNRRNFEYKLLLKFMDILEELAKNFLDSKAKIETIFSDLKVNNNNTESTDKKPLRIFEKVIYNNPIPIRKRSDGTDSSAGFPLPSISSIESVVSDIESDCSNIELPAEDTKLLQAAFGKLLAGENIDEVAKQKLVDSMQYLDGRLKTSVLLSKITQRINLPYNVFKTLGDILNNFLNIILIYNDTNVIHLTTVLNCAFLINTFDPPGSSCRLYLREMISNNPIWNSKERWLGIIQHNIDKTYSSLVEARRQVTEDTKQNFMQKIWSLGTKLVSKEQSASAMKDYSEWNAIITSELLSVAVRLSLMGINLDMGRDILIHFALFYTVQQEKLFQVLSEYESSHPLARKKITKNTDKQKVYLLRKTIQSKHYNDSALMIAIKLSIAFMDSKKTLMNLLVLNKEWQRAFRKCVYKNVLKRSNKSESIKIWESMLHMKGLRALYTKIKTGDLKNLKETLKSIDRVIKSDVKSSFALFNKTDRKVTI